MHSVKLSDNFKQPKRLVKLRYFKTYFFSICRFGAYLTTLYLVTKVLYFLNVVGQLFLLNLVLATDYSIYGIEVSNHGDDNLSNQNYNHSQILNFINLWFVQT